MYNNLMRRVRQSISTLPWIDAFYGYSVVLPKRKTRFRSASHGIGFVNKSAGFSFDGVYSKLMSPNLTCSFDVSRLCLFPFTVLAIDPVLSACIDICVCAVNPISLNNFHMA